jgi:cystathionine beta-synthase
MIEKAEAEGLLKPGSTIIEATAGNTGAGVAMVAAQKGYRCMFVLPDKMSSDKVNLLKAYGADVVITPTSVPPDSPESYNGVADRLAREIPGAFRLGQFSNLANPEAHYRSTGPEIWDDLDGRLDAFVCGMGTGGTISGVGKFLKEKNPAIQIIGADPNGSILSGDAPASYKVEGIGEDFIPLTFNRQVVDDMVRVSDAESFTMARQLARLEGILVGGSAGTAMAAAVKYSHRLPAGSVIVVLFPDTGRNYLTKVFNDDWMAEHGFLESSKPRVSVGDVVRSKQSSGPGLIALSSQQSAREAFETLKRHAISQLPVIDDGVHVGSVQESTLLKLVYDGVALDGQPIRDIMGKPFHILDESIDMAEAYRLLMAGHMGLLVTRDNAFCGFLTRFDLLDYGARVVQPSRMSSVAG